jgi:hypothetical protein
LFHVSRAGGKNDCGHIVCFSTRRTFGEIFF